MSRALWLREGSVVAQEHPPSRARSRTAEPSSPGLPKALDFLTRIGKRCLGSHLLRFDDCLQGTRLGVRFFRRKFFGLQKLLDSHSLDKCLASVGEFVKEELF